MLPQPPLQENRGNVLFAGNPSVVMASDVRVGVVNSDVMMDLIGNSYNRLEKDENKQILACRHLVQQRSMYPLYPAPAPVDVMRIQKLQWKETPDIQIIATDKMKFVHEVDGTLFVAPGPLTLGNGGGTYASITVYPRKEGVEESAVPKRCKVEINAIFIVCSPWTKTSYYSLCTI